MERNAGMILRVLKRLKTAVGYQELAMSQHALHCLDSLSQLGNIGPFGLVADVLRSEFVKGASSRSSTAKALETVACMLPTPGRHAIQATLAACYGHVSDSSRSANKKASARGALPKVEARHA
jgi:hypothetical protein